ncbi:hypothetical protein EJ04DRAFT_578840 [Polyplosphaeria fusca]|uniref:Uncharacterized protein n=1 Tax=Polyplosphaeria fusca TaxID=682080 RepID=A0A9P4V0Y9_9PLEO|nr:hypothetical protein EJ04DRAFT_578840 [Polyplosphaeria fusca]
MASNKPFGFSLKEGTSRAQAQLGKSEKPGESEKSAANPNIEEQEDEGIMEQSIATVPQNSSRHFAGGRRLVTNTLPESQIYTGSIRDRDVHNRHDDAYYANNLVAKASNLPPGFQPEEVDELFDDVWDVLEPVDVKFLRNCHPPQVMARPFLEMTIEFAPGTDPKQLTDFAKKHDNKLYLSRGYYLRIDRYLGSQSDALGRAIPLPYGARWVLPDGPKREQNDFAPPSGSSESRSDPTPAQDEEPRLVVKVNCPPDLATIRLVHATVSHLILQPGFEDVLLEDEPVEFEERFAWLWDHSHPVHRFFIWTLWRTLVHPGVLNPPPSEIIEGCGIWEGPESIPFEYVGDIINVPPGAVDPHDDFNGEFRHLRIDPEDEYPGYHDDGFGYLNKLAELKLEFFLEGLPLALTDEPLVPFGMITVFCLGHLSHGLTECAEYLVKNVLEPRNWRNIEPAKKTPANRLKCAEVGMSAITDLLICIEKHGGKAYSYRDALNKEMKKQGLFEFLDKLVRENTEGRQSLDYWQNKINEYLNIWSTEDWNLGIEDVPHFREVFNAQQREEDRVREQERRDRFKAEKRARQKAKKKANAQQTSVEQDSDVASPPGDSPASPGGAIAAAEDTNVGGETSAAGETTAAPLRRSRPKAEDLFD